MGLWGDVEQVGEDIFGVATDAPLGELAGALEPLVEQLAQINSDFTRALDSMAWSGAAADAFRKTAAQRTTQITDLMHQVQDAADAAKAAAALIF